MNEIVFPLVMLVVTVGIPIGILSLRDLVNRRRLENRRSQYEEQRSDNSDLPRDWEFQFRFQPTVKEESERLRWEERSEFGPRILQALGVVLALFVVIMCIDWALGSREVGEDGESGWKWLLLALLWLWMLVGHPILSRLRIRKLSLAGELPAWVVLGNGEGLHFGEEKVEWPMIYKWRETRNGILFVLRDNTRRFLPHSAFQSSEQKNEFLRIVKMIVEGE